MRSWTRPPTGAGTWSPGGRCRPFLPATATSHSRRSCPPILPARVVGIRRCPQRWLPRCWCCRRWRACQTGRRSVRCGAISPGRSPAGCGWTMRVSSHGAGVLAGAPAGLGAAAADLGGGLPGRGPDRGAHGRGSAGAGLHGRGGCGRDSGHRQTAGRGGPSGAAADPPQGRQRPGHLHVDPEARHTRKTGAQRRDGYKGHIAAEPESGLVTECAPTAANGPDGPTGVGLLAGEDPGLEVLGDTHYGSGQTRAALRAAGHLQTIKPIPLSSAARCGGRCGSPRSTCAGCWCLALPAMMAPGSWPETGSHRPG
jgi:hypothetical protein